jgi:hypothetical protein
VTVRVDQAWNEISSLGVDCCGSSGAGVVDNSTDQDHSFVLWKPAPFKTWASTNAVFGGAYLFCSAAIPHVLANAIKEKSMGMGVIVRVDKQKDFGKLG